MTAGNHSCPGAALSKSIVKIFAYVLLERFDFCVEQQQQQPAQSRDQQTHNVSFGDRGTENAMMMMMPGQQMQSPQGNLKMSYFNCRDSYSH